MSRAVRTETRAKPPWKTHVVVSSVVAARPMTTAKATAPRTPRPTVVVPESAMGRTRRVASGLEVRLDRRGWARQMARAAPMSTAWARVSVP